MTNLQQPIKCHLKFNAAGVHLQQLMSGFSLLQKKGMISLTYEKTTDFSPHHKFRPVLFAEINGSSVVYEMFDGGGTSEVVDLNKIDFYFKRSFDPQIINASSHSEKFFPYGLNYCVFEKGSLNEHVDLAANKKDRLYAVMLKSKLLTRFMNIQNSRHVSTSKHLEDEPRMSKDPKVLFSVRLWDPATQQDEEAAEDFRKINEMRIACVRELKKELGSRYIGGLIPSPFTLENAPSDLILSDFSPLRRKYIQTKKSADVCITTTGLHRSIGWKFAEYIVASKAIVTEPLNFVVPGDLAEGKNYLPFQTTEECIEKALELANNDDLRFEMMKANQAYYQNYLKPEKIVMNTIEKVVESQVKA